MIFIYKNINLLFLLLHCHITVILLIFISVYDVTSYKLNLKKNKTLKQELKKLEEEDLSNFLTKP
jgi:hypothetical protein